MFTKERRMDLRDERVRLQRKLCPLKDIEMWEPEKLTPKQRAQIQILENKIAELREAEKEVA